MSWQKIGNIKGPQGDAGVATAKAPLLLSGTKLSLGTVPVSKGGTGLTASPSMITNLSSTAAANVLQASPRPGVAGVLPIANGGTGLTSAPSMLTNLSSAAAESPLQTSPRPGVTGILPAANGGTGTTTGLDGVYTQQKEGGDSFDIECTLHATDVYIYSTASTNNAIRFVYLCFMRFGNNMNIRMWGKFNGNRTSPSASFQFEEARCITPEPLSAYFNGKTHSVTIYYFTAESTSISSVNATISLDNSMNSIVVNIDSPYLPTNNDTTFCCYQQVSIQ